MYRTTPWIVDETHTHSPDRKKPCYYCSALLGQEHLSSCVTRRRTVVVSFTFELVWKVPEDWDKDMIEFHVNDSSWCGSNIIPELERLSRDEKCLCFMLVGRYVREATSADENAYQVTVENDEEQ